MDDINDIPLLFVAANCLPEKMIEFESFSFHWFVLSSGWKQQRGMLHTGREAWVHAIGWVASPFCENHFK
jgi:hypothetical protein